MASFWKSLAVTSLTDRTTRCMELLPSKVPISVDVPFSLTSVHRFVHQPLSSFSFHTIEFNKPEIILLSILSFLFCFFRAKQ